jgi:hypothetical protein
MMSATPRERLESLRHCQAQNSHAHSDTAQFRIQRFQRSSDVTISPRVTILVIS